MYVEDARMILTCSSCFEVATYTLLRGAEMREYLGKYLDAGTDHTSYWHATCYSKDILKID